MVGWHHQPDGPEFEQALGVGDGQGDLAHYSPWSHEESDMTGQLNNNNKPNFPINTTKLIMWVGTLQHE